MIERRTLQHTLRMLLLQQIIADPESYLELFLGEDGYIARAERFDYPKPSDEDAAFPPEFFSLIDFLNYCASAFPDSIATTAAPGRFLQLISRRHREGKGFGWIADDPRLKRAAEPAVSAAA